MKKELLKEELERLCCEAAYGNNTYVTIDQYGIILYSQDGLNWNDTFISYENLKSRLNNEIIHKFHRINFINGFFILSDKDKYYKDPPYRFAISKDGINYNYITNEEELSNIIGNGIDKLINKEQSINAKQKILEEPVYNMLEANNITIYVCRKYFIINGDGLDFKINYEGFFPSCMFYVKDQNRYLMFSGNGIYNLDLESKTVEKVGNLPNTFMSIKYINGLFLAFSGNSIFYGRDGINYTEANIEQKNNGSIIMDIIYGHNGFVAIGFDKFLHSYDGMNYTNCNIPHHLLTKDKIKFLSYF